MEISLPSVSCNRRATSYLRRINRKVVLPFSAALTAILLASSVTRAAVRMETGGKLQVGSSSSVAVIATDPVAERLLRQDLRRAGLLAGASAVNPTTLTVTILQRDLEACMSLDTLTEGDPEVASLLKKAGIKPPPLGCAQGGGHPNQARIRQEFLNGTSPRLGAAAPGEMEPYEPGMGMVGVPAPPESRAQGVPIVIGRATLSDRDGQLTVLAIPGPGENTDTIKKLISQQIASALLGSRNPQPAPSAPES